MNKEIEKIQTELGLFLIEIMPVKWKKICLYAECEEGHNSFWGCFQEELTDLIITTESFYSRYQNYAYKENEIQRILSNLIFKLYTEYKKEVGQNKIWSTMTYIVESNKTIKIDFGYDVPDTSLTGILKKRKALTNKYFGKDYTYTDKKYPY